MELFSKLFGKSSVALEDALPSRPSRSAIQSQVGTQANVNVFDAVKTATRSISLQAVSYRDGQGFSEAELALGFSAFVVWIARATENGVSRDFVTEPNDSAREVAVNVASAIYSIPPCTAEMQQHFPGFDSGAEIRMAQQPVYPDDSRFADWKFSSTRSMILLVRHLAYDICQDAGVIGRMIESDCTFLTILSQHRPAELIQPTAGWLKQSGLLHISQAISGLHLCPDSETKRIGETFEPGHSFNGVPLEKTFQTALALAKQGNHDVAVEMLEHVISIAPNWAEAHHFLGVEYSLIRRLDEAVLAFQRSLEIGGLSTQLETGSYYLLCICFGSLRTPQKIRQLLPHLEALSPYLAAEVRKKL